MGSDGGNNNQIIVTNGARFTVGTAVTVGGGTAPSTNNSVLVTGNGSLWTIGATLTIGNLGQANQLTIADGGTVLTTNLNVGATTNSINNRLTLAGGNLFVTNAAGTASANILRGTLTLNRGTLTVDRLNLTNGAPSVIAFQRGTINSKQTVISNGVLFTIGNGTGPARFNTVGGTHSFANGVVVARDGTLAGTGKIRGKVTAAQGGTVSPGLSSGLITIHGDLAFNDGSVYHWELDNVGNDVMKVTDTLSFGGHLTVELVNLTDRAVSPTEQFLLAEYGRLSGWPRKITFASTTLTSGNGLHLRDDGVGHIWLTGLERDRGNAQVASLNWFGRARLLAGRFQL
jgi:T5SS/PEP-CTERM-associated repeat protein